MNYPFDGNNYNIGTSPNYYSPPPSAQPPQRQPYDPLNLYGNQQNIMNNNAGVVRDNGIRVERAAGFEAMKAAPASVSHTNVYIDSSASKVYIKFVNNDGLWVYQTYEQVPNPIPPPTSEERIAVLERTIIDLKAIIADGTNTKVKKVKNTESTNNESNELNAAV